MYSFIFCGNFFPEAGVFETPQEAFDALKLRAKTHNVPDQAYKVVKLTPMVAETVITTVWKEAK